MGFRHIILAVLLLALPGCTYWRQVPLTNRNHPSGWSDQIRFAAVEAYEYAQMSNNAYASGHRYDLGPQFSNPENQPNDDLGFAYSVFERRVAGRPQEVIIAYRGTELPSARDWVPGNILGLQNARGLAVFERIRNSTPRSIPVTVTGHSLGGGIATHVSLRHPNVRTYIFNSSPRFWKKRDIPDNRRLSIVEYGEALKVGRLLGREAPQTYVSINCRRGFHPFEHHRIRGLGDCLTAIAAWEDPGARASLARNSIPWPTGLPRT
jgi:Serine aminopeptidase, S33